MSHWNPVKQPDSSGHSSASNKIAAACESLSKAIVTLSSGFDMLESRLNPAMSPSKEAVTVKAPPTDPGGSPLYMDLLRMTADVDSMLARLGRIIGELEL